MGFVLMTPIDDDEEVAVASEELEVGALVAVVWDATALSWVPLVVVPTEEADDEVDESLALFFCDGQRKQSAQ